MFEICFGGIIPLIVPLVPTGMYTGVKTSPWGSVIIADLALP